MSAGGERVLPPNWAYATISELTPKDGVFIDGDWVESKDQDANGGVRLIQLADVGDSTFIDKSNRHLTKKKAHELNCTFLKSGDLLVARMPDPLGRCCIFPLDGDERFVTVVDVCIIRVLNTSVDPKYLMHRINSPLIRSEISDRQSGSTRKRISRGNLARIKLPIAPLDEQRRIVAKIDELFSELDKGVESLTTGRRQLMAYKQSLLDKHFASAGEFRPLTSLLQVPMSNGYSGKPVKSETAFKVLSLSATTTGVFEPHHFKYLDEAGLEHRDIWCETEDILVQRGNTAEYVGVPAIYTGAGNEFIFPDLMIRLRANRDLILPRYLYYALSSPRIRNYLRAKAKGSAGTMPKISQAILSSVQIPYRALRDQLAIVQRLDEIFSSIVALEKTFEEQGLRASALRQATLQRAFSGRLVAQDPRDEPASVLLERIHAEGKDGTSRHRNSKNGKKEAA